MTPAELPIELNCPRIYETSTVYWEGSGVKDHCAGCGGMKAEHVSEVNAIIREQQISEEYWLAGGHSRQDKKKAMNDAIERLKKFILDDGEKRMPDAASGHPCDMIILYVLELEEKLAEMVAFMEAHGE